MGRKVLITSFGGEYYEVVLVCWTCKVPHRMIIFKVQQTRHPPFSFYQLNVPLDHEECSS